MQPQTSSGFQSEPSRGPSCSAVGSLETLQLSDEAFPIDFLAEVAGSLPWLMHFEIPLLEMHVHQVLWVTCVLA